MNAENDAMEFDEEIAAMFEPSVEQQVAEFIRKETAKVQAKQLQHDALNKAKAAAKRDFLAHCKRHLVGNAVTVMKAAQELIRAGWTVDLNTMLMQPWCVELFLTPPDKELKAGIRKAQREAVAACKLRHEVELKNALDTIQIQAGELYDRLMVEQAIERQKRARDALIAKLVLGEKTSA